jgi:hypothetical protein
MTEVALFYLQTSDSIRPKYKQLQNKRSEQDTSSNQQHIPTIYTSCKKTVLKDVSHMAEEEQAI